MTVQMVIPAAVLAGAAAVLIADNSRFVVRRFTVRDQGIRGNLRIVFLTDLHEKVYGRDNRPVLRALSDLDPDAVILGGDLIIYKKAERGKDSSSHSLSLLSGIARRWPVYYSNGNHEQHLLEEDDTREQYELLMRRLEEMGVVLLHNSAAELCPKGTEEPAVRLQGLEIPMKFYRRFRLDRISAEQITQLIGKKEEGHYTVLLPHTPDQLEAYAAWGADLCLCGHLHGGIARLPLIGGVLGPQTGLFPRRTAGMHSMKRPDGGLCRMIVSCGMGMHKLPVRFLNPGELTVIDLEQGTPEGKQEFV